VPHVTGDVCHMSQVTCVTCHSASPHAMSHADEGGGAGAGASGVAGDELWTTLLGEGLLLALDALGEAFEV